MITYNVQIEIFRNQFRNATNLKISMKESDTPIYYLKNKWFLLLFFKYNVNNYRFNRVNIDYNVITYNIL